LLIVVALFSPLVLAPFLVDHLVDAPLAQLHDLIKLELLLELDHLLLVQLALQEVELVRQL
jgi:hypothetical protein